MPFHPSIDVAQKVPTVAQGDQSQPPSLHIPTTPNKSCSLISTRHRNRMHAIPFHNRHRHFSLKLFRPPNIHLPANRSVRGKMAAQTNGTNGVPADASSGNSPRKLKILMLHGAHPTLSHSCSESLVLV